MTVSGKKQSYPLELFKEFAGMGFLGIRFSEEYECIGGDYWYIVILCEELKRSGRIGMLITSQ